MIAMLETLTVVGVVRFSYLCAAVYWVLWSFMTTPTGDYKCTIDLVLTDVCCASKRGSPFVACARGSPPANSRDLC